MSDNRLGHSHSKLPRLVSGISFARFPSEVPKQSRAPRLFGARFVLDVPDPASPKRIWIIMVIGPEISQSGYPRNAELSRQTIAEQ